jgi:hypothetical protein
VNPSWQLFMDFQLFAIISNKVVVAPKVVTIRSSRMVGAPLGLDDFACVMCINTPWTWQ